jgi:hypothetical protein
MEHVVRVVEDGALATGAGWVMARTENGELYFLVERSAASDEQVLTDAWATARRLENANDEIEQAVYAGLGFPTPRSPLPSEQPRPS